MTTSTPTQVRNADLSEIAERLKTDQARKHDVIAPASAISSVDGRLVVANGQTTISLEDGVGTSDLHLDHGKVSLGQLASRLDIPIKYLRKLHEMGLRLDKDGNQSDSSLVDLFDANVNEWLARSTDSFMVRSFEPSYLTGVGFCRAFLSDRYRVIDDLDVLTAALDGLQSTGIDAQVVGCDLSENRMRVRVQAQEISALAPELLKGYRSPFDGKEGDQNPTVFAGFEISNSETGGGSYTIVPRLVVQVCTNGMRMTKDATKKIHLGSKMEEGIVRWSDETQQANLNLVKATTADAVRTFMDVEYVKAKLAELEEAASTKLTDPMGAVEHVSKKLAWSETERIGIFSHFIQGGQATAGGVMQAATSWAQTVADPDRAAEIEDDAVPAMSLAAAF